MGLQPLASGAQRESDADQKGWGRKGTAKSIIFGRGMKRKALS